MFFNSWFDLLRVIVVGALAYLALIVLLRTFGKRTLSKMNAFDLVVTVALGSILATIPLSKDLALTEGILAFAVLMGLQYGISWSSVRWATIRDLVKSEPALLLHRGELLHGAMKKERVAEEEIRYAARLQGFAALEEIEAVVLETDGTFSVVSKRDGSEASALADVSRSNEKTR